MKTYVKGFTNGRYFLIQMPQSKIKKFFLYVKKYIYAWNCFLYQFDNSQGEYTKILRSFPGYKTKHFGTYQWKN